MSDRSKPLPSAFRVLPCPKPGRASSQTCFQFPQLTLIRATTCALFGLSGFRKSTGIKRFRTLFTPWFLEFRDYFFAFFDLRTLVKKIGGVGSPLWLTAIHKRLPRSDFRVSNFECPCFPTVSPPAPPPRFLAPPACLHTRLRPPASEGLPAARRAGTPRNRWKTRSAAAPLPIASRARAAAPGYDKPDPARTPKG